MTLAPAPASPLSIADAISTAETELRKALPGAPPEIQTLALQVLDLPRGVLFDPQSLAALSSPEVARQADAAQALAAWMKFADMYLDVLRRLHRLATPAEAAS